MLHLDEEIALHEVGIINYVDWRIERRDRPTVSLSFARCLCRGSFEDPWIEGRVHQIGEFRVVHPARVSEASAQVVVIEDLEHPRYPTRDREGQRMSVQGWEEPDRRVVLGLACLAAAIASTPQLVEEVGHSPIDRAGLGLEARQVDMG